MSKQLELNTTVVRAFVWSGVVLMVVMIIAMVPLMGFLPPPPPSDSAQVIAQHFIDKKNSIRLGCLIMCIAWSFWATWGVAIAVFIRKMERGFPVLTYGAIALVAGGLPFFILIPMTWAVIAYRPETLDPSIIQIMNDWVWFDFLFTWPPFAVYMVLIAIAIFNDHNVPTIYPRWVAYANVWCAILIFPAGLIAFFHKGLFAYNGVGAFWIPFFFFFGWMVLMTVTTLQVTTKQQRRLEAETAPRETVPV